LIDALLSLLDEKGKHRVVMGTTQSVSSVVIYGPDGNVRWIAP
jgi:hypothetical protein